MKKFLIKHDLEAGQVLIIVAIMMFAIIAMAALILDGGALMSNRRVAQAAADSGALAGAQCICTGDCPGGSPEGTAILYATNNGAEEGPAVSVSGGEVTVQATVENASFFARIFGEDNLTASAEAVAVCGPPSIVSSPLPIAFWHTTPPINPGETWPEEEPDLPGDYDFADVIEQLNDVESELPLDNIYIISDKVKTCIYEDGSSVCSIVDGMGGSRTWLDLSALKDPPSNPRTILQDGLDRPLGDTPIWVNSNEGSISAGYDYIEDVPQPYDLGGLDARLVAVPLFDDTCTSSCAGKPNVNYIEGFKDNFASYRVCGFASFLVTCVTKSDKCEFGCNDEGVCPGYALTTEQGLETDDKDLKNAMEGYWVYNSPLNFEMVFGGSVGEPGGILTITLIK